MNRKDLRALAVGSNPVLDPLAHLHLDNRIYTNIIRHIFYIMVQILDIYSNFWTTLHKTSRKTIQKHNIQQPDYFTPFKNWTFLVMGSTVN